MALNLLRNSRLFFTTNVDATTGTVIGTGHTAATTFEIQVLEGLSFSQNSNSEAITVSEAGTAPSRGQRSFNTSLAPVDFTFSTYIRPYKFAGDVKSEDAVLWNALAGNTAAGLAAGTSALTKSGTFSSVAYAFLSNTLTLTGTTMSIAGLSVGDDVVINGISVGTGTAASVKAVTGPARVASIAAGSITFNMANPYTVDVASAEVVITNIQFYKAPWSTSPAQAVLGFQESNRNQLQKFGLLVIVDNVTYQIDNAAMVQATIDFGLDGISTVQWTGQATALTQLAVSITTPTAGTFTTGVNGAYTQKNTTASYITNKLSTATLKTGKLLGAIAAGTPYYVAITGGSITINNNITYITPANLGIVNIPATYYTGTRSVSGTLTAYLNTGTVNGFTGGGTGNLLKDMLAAASTAIEPMFGIELAIGGSANPLKVELQMPSVSIAVPTVDVQAVVSTSINFTAAASVLTGVAANDSYDLTRTNDLTLRYYAP